MTKFKSKQYDELTKLLNQVPGVVEHMQSMEVMMAEQILKRRIDLGLTQSQVVEIVNAQGGRITQATVSNVECGDKTISSDTYNKILYALGVVGISLEYGELPKSGKRILEYS